MVKKSLLNLKTLLKFMPDLYLIMNSEFEIVAISKAYAKATQINPKNVMGRNIFDVFPDNPKDLVANGTQNLRRSLERVVKNKVPDTMAVQRYDIATFKKKGEFEEHYWSPINSPILDKDNHVIYIIHRVEDVTEFVRSKQAEMVNQSDINQIEIEIFKRAQEIQEANRQLYESEERLRLFLNSCRDYALLMLDPNGYITTWNTGAERITGYTAREIIGTSFNVFYPKKAIEAGHPEHELEMARKYGRHEDEGWRIRKDGSRFWADVIITSIYDQENHLLGYGKVTRDLSERKKAEEEIVYLSNHDSLTQLYNRAAFIETLKKEIVNSHCNHTSLAILMIDLDHFKTVNDTFGHHIGDQLLITVAKQLKESVRQEDFVARFGGDEFVILFSNIKSKENVEVLAHKLLERFSKPFILENHLFHATVSIGIALSNCSNDDEVSLVKNADIALYSVKEYGRNNFQFYSDEINAVFKRRSQVENELTSAIENNQLYLVYQPQYNLPTRKIIGIEALLRWKHPKIGLIPPSEFIPIAEKNRFIIQMGEWVLKSACSQYVKWKKKKLVAEDLKMAINVSLIQLSHEHFLKTFIKIIKQTKMPAKNLELELTESAVMATNVNIDATLAQLRKLGVTLSIDDFGTGYSSLCRLKSLPVSSLKIDKSFIEALNQSSDDAKIVKSIISLGNNLGLRVIPEGVETEDQLQLLMKYDCQIAQGFYFGKEPLNAEDMSNLLYANIEST